MTREDLTEAIASAASAPKVFQSDGTRAEQHSLRDLIEADRYLAAKAAASASPGLGIRFVKIVAPGAV